MNPTDQTIDITFRLREDSPDQRGVLKLQNNNGNTILSFFHDINQEPIRTGAPPQRRQLPQTPDFSYYLCNFSVLEIDPGSPLLITFASPRHSVSFMCHSAADVTKLTDYLSQKVGIIHSRYNPAIFKLQSADLGEFPYMTTLLPNLSRRSVRANLASLQHVTAPPASPPSALKRGNLRHDVLFNADIDRTVLFDAFTCALTPLPDLDVGYEPLKSQWAKASEGQFQNNRELTKMMRFVENDVIREAASAVRPAGGAGSGCCTGFACGVHRRPCSASEFGMRDSVLRCASRHPICPGHLNADGRLPADSAGGQPNAVRAGLRSAARPGALAPSDLAIATPAGPADVLSRSPLCAMPFPRSPFSVPADAPIARGGEPTDRVP
jgi:hypothetical protein